MADSSNENSGSRERSSSPSASATRRDDGAAAAVPPHRDEDESQLEDRQPEKRAGDFSSEAAVGKGGSALSVGWVDASVSTKPGLSLRCCGDRADSVVQLLHKQSGGIEGKFVVIMGPSGCGKTTFLNMIAKRFGAYQPGRETQLRVGGQSYSVGEFKAVSGYVLADDVLFPHLTVRETLLYGAKLRMPQETSAEEKSARVDQVIRRLGLEKCQHTPIGDSPIRGVSGGERKRVCIALELLNRPRVLLWDTLRSGLDSATAFSVCTLLADLAHSGECTVIASLNQPQIKIWKLIDQLILLYDGQLIYQGAPSRLIELYTEAGFACPAYINPADHILDVITPLFREDVPCIEANLRRLRDHLARQAADPVPSFEQRSIERNGTRSSWLQQFGVLIARATLSQVRDRFSVYLQLVQTLIMAVLVGAVFLDIGTDQTSIRLRQSVLFFCCINQGIFAALLAVNSYPADRNVVLRERAAGAYHASAYFLAKMVVELLVQMIYPLLFSVIVYWMIGLQADAGKFFLFVLFMELCSLCAHAWAMLTSAVCVTVNRSLSVLPLVFEVARLFGGFFLSPAELPAYFVWLDAVSYVKYAYTGISLNELDGLVYTCTPDQLVPPVNGTCPVTSGQQTIDALGLDYISMGGCIGVLFGLLIGLRFFNYIAMRFNKA